MCGDGAARVLRVVNRLHGDHPAEATAGYRDVLVNLALSTADTRRLRLGAAVCELQLSLVRFARIKAPPPPPAARGGAARGPAGDAN